MLAAAPVQLSSLTQLAQQCQTAGLPLIYFHSLGFYSHFSVQLPAVFPLVDTHPDPDSTLDLRVLRPWPALAELAQRYTHGLDAMTDHEHGHVPWLALLLHFLDRWKRDHDGQPPTTYRDKTEFRNLVRAAERRGTAEGGEENFEEAASAVLKTLNAPCLASGLQQVFEADECRNLTAEVGAY